VSILFRIVHEMINVDPPSIARYRQRQGNKTL
jgi:hypothetical protein